LFDIKQILAMSRDPFGIENLLDDGHALFNLLLVAHCAALLPKVAYGYTCALV